MSDWQPIETAPKDGTPIVVVGHLDGDARIRACIPFRWVDDVEAWEWRSPGFSDWFHATHWMPLPPPADVKGERLHDELVAYAAESEQTQDDGLPPFSEWQRIRRLKP